MKCRNLSCFFFFFCNNVTVLMVIVLNQQTSLDVMNTITVTILSSELAVVAHVCNSSPGKVDLEGTSAT